MSPTTNGTHQVNPLGAPTRLIVLDYYDGPIEGVMQFGDAGPVFHFALAEGEDATDVTRTYLLHPLPLDSLNRIVAALEPYSAPTWPMWFPVWRFPTPDIEATVNAVVDAVLDGSGAAEWRLTTGERGFDDYRIVCVAGIVANRG